MRQIDLTPFMVTANTVEGQQAVPYRVRDSLVELCFHPGQGVTGSELLRRNRLAEKIDLCVTETLLLEDDEWQRLVKAVESGQVPLGRNDVEVVRRILDAPDVPVKPA